MNNKDWNIKSTEIIRQCYHIAWSRGILQRTKTQDSQKLRVTFIEGWSGQWQKIKVYQRTNKLQIVEPIRNPNSLKKIP